MMGHPFTHARRGSMTPLRRAAIFARGNGLCHVCTRKLHPGDWWDCDHVIALENGGTDDDDNLAPCCEVCHAMKTGEDHAKAGKGRRNYTRHVVPKEFRKGRGWR